MSQQTKLEIAEVEAQIDAVEAKIQAAEEAKDESAAKRHQRRLDYLYKKLDCIQQTEVFILQREVSALQLEVAKASNPQTTPIVLTRLVQTLDHVAVTLNRSLNLQRLQLSATFRYSTSQATKYREPGFRKALLDAYKAKGSDGMVFCMATGEYLPPALVSAAHLFKHAWRPDVEKVMGFADINDVRNGLVLMKPIEEAFDNAYLVLEWRQGSSSTCALSPNSGGFVMHWLGNPDLQIQDLNNYPWKSNEKLDGGAQTALRALKHRSAGVPLNPGAVDAAEPLKFSHLNGTSLKFNSDVRPYRRCCAFQAERAIKDALSAGRIRLSWLTGKNFEAHSVDPAALEGWVQTAHQAEWVEVDGDAEDVHYDDSDITGSVE